jgi:hypothetical protein
MLPRTAGTHARLPDETLAPMELPVPEHPEFEMSGGGLHGTHERLRPLHPYAAKRW